MREKRCISRRHVGRVLRTTENTQRHDTLENRAQSRPGRDKKNDEATRRSELHSCGAKKLPGASNPHHLHRSL